MPARAQVAGVLAAVAAAVFAAPASAAVPAIVVRAPDGSSAVVTRSPFEIAFRDAHGRSVLREVASPAVAAQPIPATPQQQFGQQSPPPPTLYAPLGFVVGQQDIRAQPNTLWEGDLQSVTTTGVAYAARGVVSAVRTSGGVRLFVSTSDPTGRRLAVTIVPAAGGGLRVSVRPTPSAGVATMADSFGGARGEAFRGFGGRHDALDQSGHEFYNWLEQENFGSGTAGGVTAPAAGDTYMFPNGQHGAYYVQSSFVSSHGYGFLLDRSELSHWRLGSDRPDAWQVEVGAPGLDYVVAPGRPATAVARLTRSGGRQPAPPRWALGTILDREVRYPSDPPDQYRAEVAADLRDIDRYHVHLDGYRIEGWQFLPRTVLAHFIHELRRRGIHPMVYFRAFVGKDTIGTDDPHAYDEALAKGYVATTADGSPYTFVGNFNAPAAQIDFTNPAAVRWWQGRVRRALELGADGFMQDFGEQVLPDMHFHDGSTGVQMHNRLPLLYHRATAQVVRDFERSHPRRRIFYYTRAGYSGTPGSAPSEGGNFPGDETTDWSHASGLASLASDMLNRAVGGAYGFTTDIGGFFDVGPYQPTSKELFLRWTEWSALSPFFRVHGSVSAGVHTPWSYDAQTLAVFKRMAALHARLVPLFTRLWRLADRTGIPVTRPLWLAYPGDAVAARQDQEWLVGRDLLAAPVVADGARSRRAYLPAGCWQRPGGKRLAGRRFVTVPAPLGSAVYFVRCGQRTSDLWRNVP